MTYPEFWRRYLAAHADPRTRGLHYSAPLWRWRRLATARSSAIGAGWPLPRLPAMLWPGSAMLKFEHNRPETFGHPLWSLVSDFRMFGMFLSGRLGGELRGAAAERSEVTMVRLIEYNEASAEVRAVYDDIMTTRGTDWINNFWKALANDPATLRRTWQSIKEVMAPGALDPLTKELIYLAVSASNGCAYCTASHGAAAKKQGMTAEMLGELLAIVGMANETNSLANGYRVPVDERFEKLF